MPKTVKDVCGALIEKDGRYLVAKRYPHDTFGGLWEFPGGCIEAGETKEEALKREIREELGIDIEVGGLLLTLSDEIPELKINIYLFQSKITSGEPKAVDCQDIKWASPGELRRLELAPADIKILRWIEDKKRKDEA